MKEQENVMPVSKTKDYASYIKFLLIFFVFCIVLIVLDQWTKTLAVQHLKGHEDISIIPKVFSLAYVENHGAAFGILDGRQWLLTVVSAFFLILILLFTLHLFRILMQLWQDSLPVGKLIFLILCMALITSGAIGNLIDRVRQGYVVDFLYVLTKNIPLLSFDFPVFNVADCYVTVAAFSVIIIGLFFLKEEELNMIFSFGKSEAGNVEAGCNKQSPADENDTAAEACKQCQADESDSVTRE